ncbi:MAG: hypothetical protein E7459_10300, partial [Ruminococcaceae bacterium]|nr:hypothetical protein [Oscillospiraceae bacterium]
MGEWIYKSFNGGTTMKKQVLSMILALTMIITCLVSPAMASPAEPTQAEPIVLTQDAQTGDTIETQGFVRESREEITIMVQLEGETAFLQTSDLQVASEGYDNQMALLAQAENRIEAELSENIEVENRYSLLFNGFSFTGEAWMVDAINAIDGCFAFEAPVFELVAPVEDGGEDIELTPSMGVSNPFVGVNAAWDLGYTGEGMVIAIIDTGIRQTHEAFSVQPENIKMDLAYLLDVYNTHGDKLHAGTVRDLNDIYYSDKLPFNWDYFDHDAIPNHTASDHGSHVAGIAAGNNGENFKGVAPDAQIVTMQVFQNTGGASFAEIICAMEDCIYLGVDVINMSLGVAAYYPHYDTVMVGLEEVYEALETAGVSVCVSAGNEAHAYVWNNYGNYFTAKAWRASNPDTGVVGAPAVLPGSLAVAATKHAEGYSMTAYGKAYTPYQNPVYRRLYELEEGTYDLVHVSLTDATAIEAAGGLQGKIAMDKYNKSTLDAQVQAAVDGGAIALILYHSSNTAVSAPIPYGCLKNADANKLIADLEDGVKGQVAIEKEFNYNSTSMANFSSWGTTTTLAIKPEIAAPGNAIFSVKGAGSSDNTYMSSSGTSMASPNVAGCLLLVKQHLREQFPNDTAAQINEKAYAVAMTTAKQVNGFVRQQGAGMIHVESALSTKAYITVPGQDRPKLELGESEEGKFTFTFNVTNFGDTERTYGLNIEVITEQVNEIQYDGLPIADWEWRSKYGFQIGNPVTVPAKVINGTIKNVTAQCTMDGPRTVVVPAGQSVEVTMTISCKEELLTYFRENCDNGMYLEGWVLLTDTEENGVDLSVPFLGYVGDWDKPPMIDDGFWWQLPYGQNNPAQMSTTQGTYIGFGAFQPGGSLEQGLGLNPYADMTGKSYVADRNAISPNGDGYLDAVDYMEFSVLRNPKRFKAYVQDAEGNVLLTIFDRDYGFRKEYFGNYRGGNGSGFSSLTFEFTASELQENEVAYVVIEAYLDHEGFRIEDNAYAKLVIPVTKDLTAPTVTAVDGGVEVKDSNYIAYYAIYADEACTELVYETGVFAETRGVAETYTTDRTTYYVAVADYARNEAIYKVENGVVAAMDGKITKPGKTIVAQQQSNYAKGGIKEYGWNSFDANNPYVLTQLTEFTDLAQSDRNLLFDILSTAVAVDGTLYANDVMKLWKLNPDTLEREFVAEFYIDTGKSLNQVNNIMIDPVTYQAYAFFRQGAYVYMGRLDLETGAVSMDYKCGLGSNYWSATMIGENRAALAQSTGNSRIEIIDTANWVMLEKIQLADIVPPSGSLSVQTNVYGYSGCLLYDADTNVMYLGSDWSQFGKFRFETAGIIKYDLNTWTVDLLRTGKGAGVSLLGMFFPEEVKPADWYAVIQLIDSIGEVDTEDGETIKAAREAYDALADEDKAKVTNYDLLEDAEHRYCIVMGEKYASDAKKSAEDAQKAYEEAKKEAEEAKKAAEDAKKAYEDAKKETAENKEAAEKAQKAAEDAQKKAEEAQAKAEAAKAASEAAQAKAEAAQKAAEDAAKAAEESNKKAAQEALKAAEEAAKSAEESAKAAKSASDAAASANEAAKSAQAAAEAQAKAQAAQAAAEKAQKAAEEAQKKAEEAQKKAEEAADSAAEDKEAAE